MFVGKARHFLLPSGDRVEGFRDVHLVSSSWCVVEPGMRLPTARNGVQSALTYMYWVTTASPDVFVEHVLRTRFAAKTR